MRKVSRAQEQHEEINFRSAFIVEANQYIKKQGDSWVIIQKGTGKVLSHHDSEAKAEASFAAMMSNKHGSTEHTTTAAVEPWGQSEHFRVVDDATPITPHNPKGRDQCGLCSGSGLTEDEEKRSLACPHCNGRGVI